MGKIFFDTNNNVDTPTLILQNKNFDTLGSIPCFCGLAYTENFNSPNELSFTLYKYMDGKENITWGSTADHKVLYVPEFKERFVIKTSMKEIDSTQKYVTATSLCESELSGIKLYNIEVNTETDISNPDYDENFPTVFYRNPEKYSGYDWTGHKYEKYSDKQKKDTIRKSSLLHRLLEKAPHYSIKYVAPSLMGIQRSFSISDTDIYSELVNEISEEFNCLFLFDSMTREISVYDLYNTCQRCGYRGDFNEKCPECGSSKFEGQYGNDTTIFISNENLSTEIELETNADSLKNCFYVEGGDDTMTAAIRSINPNGSSYIYAITDGMKMDMPSTLSSALDSYHRLYSEHATSHAYVLNKDSVDKYNSVVKYVNSRFPDSKYALLPTYSIIGYPSTTSALYEAIDLYEFINSSMMPTIQTSGLGIDESMQSIIDGFKDGFSSNGTTFTNEIAIDNHKNAILSTVERAILNNAKIFYSPAYYDLKADTQTYIKATGSANGVWEGFLTLTSFTQKDDDGEKIAKTSQLLRLSISNRTALFVEQKIYRAMADKEKIGRYDITNLKLDENTFKSQLGLYSLSELQSLSDSFQGCLDVILSMDIEDTEPNEKLLDGYGKFYTTRKHFVDDEILVRNQMLEYVKNIYYYDPEAGEASGELYGIREQTNKILNFEKYIKGLPNGEKLWKTFCSYRMEDKYSNTNYISDGMSNAEIIENAKKLLDIANKELYRASHPQYTLTAKMNNLMALKEFQPLVRSFSVGNWLRLEIDGKIFRLRLLSYSVNFDEIQSIDVEFSTVEKIWSGGSDVKSIIESAVSIAQSYSGITQQMDKSSQTTKYVQSWLDNGFKATQTKFSNSDNQDIVIDRHGILARAYDDITNSYHPCQLKILGNGLYMTNDGWKTIYAGIGRIAYTDPETGGQVEDYGVIAKTVTGKLILGETLKIYNLNGSLKFTDNGLEITNGKNSFIVNPNDSSGLVRILKGSKNQFYINSNGDVCLSGSINIGEGKFIVDTSGNVTSAGTLSVGNGKLSYTAASGLKVDGIIMTKSGSKIGGWVVTDNALYNGSLTGNSSGDTGISTADFTRTVNGTERRNLRLAIGNNFAVNKDGVLYCTNADISGQITAKSGTIGNFNIGEEYIANGTTSIGTDNNSVYIGTNGISCGTGFIAYNTGDCKIQGQITAKGGIMLQGGVWTYDPRPGRPPTFHPDTTLVEINTGQREAPNNGNIGVISYVKGLCISGDVILNKLYFSDGVGVSASLSPYGLFVNNGQYFSTIISFSGKECNIGNYGVDVVIGGSGMPVNAALLKADIRTLSVKEKFSAGCNIVPTENNKTIGTSGHPWKNMFTESICLNPTEYETVSRINCMYADWELHDVITAHDDGLTTSIGWSGITDNATWATELKLRGQTVTAPNVGGITIKSDERLKNSFEGLEKYEQVFMELKPVSFRYNDGNSGRKHFGFGAGQVKKSLEKFNLTTKDFAGFVQMKNPPDQPPEIQDPMGLIYTEFVAWNTHMIQKAILENIELKSRIEKLERAAGSIE